MATQSENRLLRFFRSEEGPTTVEYAIMLGVIIISSIGAVLSMGNFQAQLFGTCATAVENVLTSANAAN